MRVLRTTAASCSSSTSTPRGGHNDDCILAMKPSHGANRQRIASSRSSFFRHRIVDLKVGRSRHFIRQKCRFSPPHGEAARHSRLPFSGGPGSSAWRKSPNIQALPEGATTVADRGFNAAGSQRTSRCSTVGRLHDWHQAKRCAVGSSLPNPKRCAVGKSEAMRCRLAQC